jgi:hypothetical protein
MIMRAILTALGLVCLAAPAIADCRFSGANFFPSQNDTSQYVGVADKHGCFHSFFSSATGSVTSVSIKRQPTNGVLRQVERLKFTYQPRKDFKGVDSYVLSVCGADASGSGCSTVIYKVTIE